MDDQARIIIQFADGSRQERVIEIRDGILPDVQTWHSFEGDRVLRTDPIPDTVPAPRRHFAKLSHREGVDVATAIPVYVETK